jgi:hypothetical protein
VSERNTKGVDMMKRILPALVFGGALLLGSAGASWSADNQIITKKKIINTEFSFEITKKTISDSSPKTIKFFRNGKMVLSKTAEISVAARTSDINGDQREEVLVTLTDGGNCCAPYVNLYYVDTQTNELKEFTFGEWQVWNGWDDARIETLDNVATLTSTNNYDGRNPDLARSEVSYKFDGSNVSISAIIKHTKIPALAELKSTDFDTEFEERGKKKYLKFDLNSDGKVETVGCEYWMRWGELIRCSVTSEKYGNVFKSSQNTGLGKRFGVLPEKQNGWHILVVDFNERWIFSPRENRYRKDAEY